MTLATQIVHWPGKDTAACDKHAAQLKRVGSAMGFAVSSTTTIDYEIPCENCVNEEQLMDSRDRKAIINLFSDWLDSSTRFQLAQAGKWLEVQAKMRCYHGAIDDLQRVNKLVRDAMEEQWQRQQ